MKNKIYAIQKGSLITSFLDLEFDTPAIFIKENEQDDWKPMYSNQDQIILDSLWNDLIENNEITKIYTNDYF